MMTRDIINDKWNILPQRSVGPFSIDMEREEVARIGEFMGPITFVKNNRDGTISEFRELGWPEFIYRDNKIETIQIDWRCDFVYFEELNIFKEDSLSVIKKLEEINGGAFYAFGIILFSNIDISLSGFLLKEKGEDAYQFWEDSDHSMNRVMAVSKMGSYQQFVDKYEEINFGAFTP